MYLIGASKFWMFRKAIINPDGYLVTSHEVHQVKMLAKTTPKEIAWGNGKNIAGASGTSYTLTSADFGKKIRVVVTGSNSEYNSATKYSTAVFAAKVVNKPAWKYVNVRKSTSSSSAYQGRINAGKMVALQRYMHDSKVTSPYSNRHSGLKYQAAAGSLRHYSKPNRITQ